MSYLAPQREAEIAAFLAATPWRDAARAPLAGDASNRRYERLAGGPGGGAVLMDAPPERGEDLGRFLDVAAHLAGLGLSPPRIHAADRARGLALVEDLGDGIYARLIEADPSREMQLYEVAADLLADLARHPPPDFAQPFVPEPRPLAFDFYAAGAGVDFPQAARADYLGAMADLLAGLPEQAPKLLLRDFHAENLIWLPARSGPARVGLLDFQDAVTGPPVYDLVSLLEDARRDVSPEVAQAMRAHLCRALGEDAETFARAAAIYGCQRNLRILGIFARLCLAGGRRGYVARLPRVWRNLRADLAHPALARAAAALSALPPPEPAVLQRLESQCGRFPRQ